ncbi:MAG: glycosyltransferase family 4 protein [Elusimicrobiota bacterium]
MKKSILHVSEATGWTGGLARLLETSLGLKRKGWDIVIACHPQSDMVAPAERGGLRILPVPVRQDYDVVAAYRIARYIKDNGVPLLHAHHPKAHAVCLLAKLLLGGSGGKAAPKLIVSRRVSYRVGWNVFSSWKYRSGLIDRYVAVAEAVKANLAAAGVAGDRVTVIRSGVDMDKFAPRTGDPALRRELGLPAQGRLVVLVGNAAPAKGQSVFLEAASLLRRKLSDVHFLLVGRDTDARWMKEHVERLKLAPAVTLAGYRTDVPEVLALADLSVNAAVAGEALSGALRESLAMEIPVVASDLSGNGELVRDGETGRLCTPGDAGSMAANMQWMLENSREAKDMARKGRLVVRAGFSLEASVDAADALYQGLLRG